METNDKLLKEFFNEHKTEIADNGFSRQLMQKLPKQADKSWIVWVFAGIGLTLTVLLGIEYGALKEMIYFLQHVSIYYLLGLVFLFPLIGSIWICLIQGKCALKY